MSSQHSCRPLELRTLSFLKCYGSRAYVLSSRSSKAPTPVYSPADWGLCGGCSGITQDTHECVGPVVGLPKERVSPMLKTQQNSQRTPRVSLSFPATNSAARGPSGTIDRALRSRADRTSSIESPPVFIGRCSPILKKSIGIQNAARRRDSVEVSARDVPLGAQQRIHRSRRLRESKKRPHPRRRKGASPQAQTSLLQLLRTRRHIFPRASKREGARVAHARTHPPSESSPRRHSGASRGKESLRRGCAPRASRATRRRRPDSLSFSTERERERVCATPLSRERERENKKKESQRRVPRGSRSRPR